MRKFLRQKIWSHGIGTPLGSLGPLSFEALGPGFDQCQILLIWGPYEYLDLVALQVQAEILKTIRSWCAYLLFLLSFHFSRLLLTIEHAILQTCEKN